MFRDRGMCALRAVLLSAPHNGVCGRRTIAKVILMPVMSFCWRFQGLSPILRRA